MYIHNLKIKLINNDLNFTLTVDYLAKILEMMANFQIDEIYNVDTLLKLIQELKLEYLFEDQNIEIVLRVLQPLIFEINHSLDINFKTKRLVENLKDLTLEELKFMTVSNLLYETSLKLYEKFTYDDLLIGEQIIYVDYKTLQIILINVLHNFNYTVENIKTKQKLKYIDVFNSNFISALKLKHILQTEFENNFDLDFKTKRLLGTLRTLTVGDLKGMTNPELLYIPSIKLV